MLSQNIPAERGNRSTKAIIILCFILITIGCIEVDRDLIMNYLMLILFIPIPISLVALLHRICYVFEEMQHLQSRYDGSWKMMFSDIFQFKMSIVLAVPFSVALCFSIKVDLIEFISGNIGPFIIYGIVVLMVYSSNIMNQMDCSVTHSRSFKHLQGSDYGSGIAYSFYYGYLRIILPPKQNGIVENMEIYETQENVKFASKKLYILIPLSTYCPNSIKDRKFPSVFDEAKTLPELLIKIAGVRDRSYKNSVYKIVVENPRKKLYVCMEYATPLLTLHKTFEHDKDNTSFYRKHKKEIVNNFYYTLKYLVEKDWEIKDRCELVYYDDLNEDGTSMVDVGTIIADRIMHQKNNI